MNFDVDYKLRQSKKWIIHAFAVAAFLRPLVARVALTLEGSLGIDAAAVRAQPDVLALVDVCVPEEERAMSGKLVCHETSTPTRPLKGLNNYLAQAKSSSARDLISGKSI